MQWKASRGWVYATLWAVAGCYEAPPIPACALSELGCGEPAGGACSADSDCDDGSACTGEERCVGGICEEGVAVDCEGTRRACRLRDEALICREAIGPPGG